MRITKLFALSALLLAVAWLWRRLGDDSIVDIAPPLTQPNAENLASSQ